MKATVLAFVHLANTALSLFRTSFATAFVACMLCLTRLMRENTASSSESIGKGVCEDYGGDQTFE